MKRNKSGVLLVRRGIAVLLLSWLVVVSACQSKTPKPGAQPGVQQVEALTRGTAYVQIEEILDGAPPSGGP